MSELRGHRGRKSFGTPLLMSGNVDPLDIMLAGSADLTEEERQKWYTRIWGPLGLSFDREQFDIFVALCKKQAQDADLGMAIVLWTSGWESETVRNGLPIMSWYWRRPPRPGQKKGRLFRSTHQAFRHLQKEIEATRST